MIRFKRYFHIMLAVIVSCLVFLTGYITALGYSPLQLHEVGEAMLTNTEWVAIQASNSLLMGGFSFPIYLPLLFH